MRRSLSHKYNNILSLFLVIGANVNIFESSLSQVSVGFPISMQNLTMFPLEAETNEKENYLDFSEQVNLGTVKVTEVDESGSVPTLFVENKNKEAVFILDGEHLIGAKQDRIVNLSILLPALKKIEIPVSCVEQGRWSYNSEYFFSEGKMHFNRGRRRRQRSVSESMASRRTRRSDQSEVWNDINDKERLMGAQSRTSSMRDMYNSFDEILSLIKQGMRPTPNQVGSLFSINERIIGFDLFNSRDTLNKHIEKLVESMAVDALEHRITSPHPTREEARSFFEEFSALKTSKYPALGLGEDVRAYSDRLTASALVHKDKAVHVSGFILDSNIRGSSKRRRSFEQIRRSRSGS